MTIYFHETRFGFDYGDARVTRTYSDEKKGWVVIAIGTSKTNLQIKVSKTGVMTLYNWKGERLSVEPVKKARKR